MTLENLFSLVDFMQANEMSRNDKEKETSNEVSFLLQGSIVCSRFIFCALRFCGRLIASPTDVFMLFREGRPLPYELDIFSVIDIIRPFPNLLDFHRCILIFVRNLVYCVSRGRRMSVGKYFLRCLYYKIV